MVTTLYPNTWDLYWDYVQFGYLIEYFGDYEVRGLGNGVLEIPGIAGIVVSPRVYEEDEEDEL